MQFSLNEVQKEIQENSTKILKDNIDLLNTIQQVDENCRIDRKIWSLVNEQGWLALDVPEELGGLGFSSADASILSEVLGYFMPIIPTFSSGIVFKNLLLSSSENIRDELLPEIISGEKIGTYAIYESSSYELSAENVGSELSKHPDGYVLNGSKKYVMFGDVSEYIAVLAKYDQNLMFVLCLLYTSPSPRD